VPHYINWIVYLGVAIAMILIIYNGIVMITSSGDEGKFNAAKSRLIALLS